MKKSILVLMVVFLFALVYVGIKEFQKNSIVKEAQNEAVMYMLSNYDDVTSVTMFEKEYKFHSAEKEEIAVSGFVNHDDSLNFSIHFDTTGNHIGPVTTVKAASNFPKAKK